MNPPELLIRLARAARWHRRGLGIAAAVVCLFATLSALTQPGVETAPAVVAARELRAGTQLAAADLQLVQLPLTAIPEKALTEVSAALGRTLTGSLTRGSVLTAVSTLSATESGAGPGEQLVPFRVPDAAAVSLLQVGDRITVVGASVDGSAIDVATNVRVAALPVAAGGAWGGESGALVVVAADPQTAARLAAAASQMRLAIVLQ